MKAAIETFKDIPGYEGLYQVSDYGSVRSLRFGKVKYLKNVKNYLSYEQIGLSRNGKRQWFRVNRLVYETFVEKIPNGMQIDHINGVRDDNRLINLRVVTPKENSNNPITLERIRNAGKLLAKNQKWFEAHRESVRKSCSKPVLQLDKQTGEIIRKWDCIADVEREIGINDGNISSCCLGNRKSAGGFRWCFA